jgi:hypothetical protein
LWPCYQHFDKSLLPPTPKESRTYLSNKFRIELFSNTTEAIEVDGNDNSDDDSFNNNDNDSDDEFDDAE